jgi:hypothetical protein
MHAAIDAALTGHYDDMSFATGIVARLATGSGRLEWSCAGHPQPLLLRGRKIVAELSCDPVLPFGLGDGAPKPRVAELEPDDAVLYLPSGWLHSAVARQGTSIHLTIGVAALTGADVVRELVAEISRRPELRAPLPLNVSDAGPDVLADAVRDITAAFNQALQSSYRAARRGGGVPDRGHPPPAPAPARGRSALALGPGRVHARPRGHCLGGGRRSGGLPDRSLQPARNAVGDHRHRGVRARPARPVLRRPRPVRGRPAEKGRSRRCMGVLSYRRRPIRRDHAAAPARDQLRLG